MFGNKDSFRVLGKKSLSTAERMLSCVENNQFSVPPLLTKLREIIEYGEKRIQEDADALRTRQSQNEAVLEKMK